MKKLIFLLLTVSLVQSQGHAQVTLQPSIPVVGLVQKNQLWNVLLVNSSAVTYECRLELTVRDRSSGQEVFTATTTGFNLAPGAKQLNVNILSPVQYNYLSGSGASSIQGLIPAGNYTACYRLTGTSIKDISLAEECVQFDTEPLSPPMLIFPADSALLENAPAQLSWIPPTPAGMFDRLQYEVLVTRINEGQTANDAIQQNLPFYNDANLYMNFLNYPSSALHFEPNQWYAWQVTARDNNNYAGKSEVWVFKVKPPSFEKMIVEQAPYIVMKKDNPEKGIAPNGILKLSYRNEASDSIAVIRITELNAAGKRTASFNVALTAGENLIEYNLKKLLTVQEGNTYQAELINSRQERWMLVFNYRNYEEKKVKE